MSSARTYGMILAAGFGTRLRPLTERVPKSIVEVAGKPLIYYALENMAKAGVSRVIINTHYLPDLVVECVDAKEWPLEICFSHESEILGTGGAIRFAQPLMAGADAILVQNADAIIEIEAKRLLHAHFAFDPLATMVLKEVPDPDAFGAIATDADDRVLDIVGKVGHQQQPKQRRMFCGMYVLSSNIFGKMPAQGCFGILDEVLVPAIKRGEVVRAFDQKGYFCDVGTPERLQSANAHFSR